MGLHAPDWKRGAKEVRLKNAESSVGSSCPRPPWGPSSAVRWPSVHPARLRGWVQAQGGGTERAAGGRSQGPSRRARAGHPPPRAAAPTGTRGLCQQVGRGYRRNTCAILHMRDWRQRHGDPRQIPCSPHIKMAIKGGLCGFFRKNG